LILAPSPCDCAALLTWRAEWHADCAYLIMWHADCIINFVFHFFKGTHGICVYFLKKIVKIRKNSGFFLLRKIFSKILKYIFLENSKIYNLRKISISKNFKIIFENFQIYISNKIKFKLFSKILKYIFFKNLKINFFQ